MNHLSKEEFDILLKRINAPCQQDSDFLFKAYKDALEGIIELKVNNPLISGIDINHIQLILYISNEHAFHIALQDKNKREEIIQSDEYETVILSLAIDKYYTNEHLDWQNGSMSNRYLPEISTIDLYLNFILGILNRYASGNPEYTLLTDIMKKGFSMAKCIVSLLTAGFETEAFSTWRTLHENECILRVLVKYKEPVIKKYLVHLRYAMAFRGSLEKEETDEVFLKIKEEMRSYSLKSKDLKRYIEYGWMLAIPNINEVEDFKLNFRDGVERLANLRSYSKVYEMSSEIAHSSPLLIYSRKTYFYLLTILNLHESFFRLEEIFTSFYLSSIPKSEQEKFLNMQALYRGELLTIHEYEKMRFQILSQNKKKGEND